MYYCKDCWNFDRCNAHGRTVDFAVDDGVCREFDLCKPQTNADRIRAMSDEELADFMTSQNRGICTDICREMYYQSNLEWLKQPAEE